MGVVLDGANRHDSKLLEDTLDDIVIARPKVTEEHPQNLCLDAGYTGKQEAVTDRLQILEKKNPLLFRCKIDLKLGYISP